MGVACLIYGRSGSGKSRSMKNFADDEIAVFNVQRKPLPFRNHFKYVITPKSGVTAEGKPFSMVDSIINAMKRMPVKTAVIDDAGYLMTNTFMQGHSKPRAGSSSFDLYNDIADEFYRLMNFITRDLPDDVIVYVMMHEATSDYGETKLRTIGKLLDEKVVLEGMVTICLRCMTDGTKHFFRTQSSGMDVSKSPEELFDSVEIDNDLKFVDDKIRDYYGFKKENENVKENA